MGLQKVLMSALLGLNLCSSALAAPTIQSTQVEARQDSGYWVASIARNGSPAFGTSGYSIFRNVKDYGATGDGATDDTAAINAAITDGSRCGQGCDSSTTTPAIIYFPPGTYIVSAPIIAYYYTQLIGDAVTLPTLKAAASFTGMAVIDADPYDENGKNWFTNQNNFFRQVRNFVIDITGMPASSGAGIHWQVAQATSLQNIRFEMSQDSSSDNKQIGIFMDNGSGGFMTDLTFNGGQYGAFLGSQQFTSRNMTFNNCQTAIFMNWNWAWTLQNLNINNCGVGIDMANGGSAAQTVGSVLVLDSTFVNTDVGIATVYNTASSSTNGTLIVENCDFSSNVPVAVKNTETEASVVNGNQAVPYFIQGREYTAVGSGQAVQTTGTAVTRPASLLDSTGKWFTKSRPQYEGVAASQFVSIKSKGAVGDGATDDTAAIQAAFDSVTDGQIVYFDHGAYLITDTVKVPANIKITGEMWPLIMAAGSANFQDQANPKPVFQVGNAGETGAVEMSDLIFETQGAQPGAILMQWNTGASSAGSNGLWDVHFRVGGSAGTQLQSDTCAKNPNTTADANMACAGAFMHLHITEQASVYLENVWSWTSDHELDLSDHNQINIFNGRGILVESVEGPVWMYGTASEHNVLYNYQIRNAKNVFMGCIQTETPYFQGNPNSLQPYNVQTSFFDPDFSTSCASSTTGTCERAWGLRVANSSDVFLYGGGLYSFFDNYSQNCLQTQNCQENMVSFESSTVHAFGLSTKASTNMLTIDGQSAALDSDNRNNFCATIATFSAS